MRALVTGARGFAGRHTVERLRAAGVETFALRRGHPRRRRLPRAGSRLAPRRRPPPRGDLVGGRRVAPSRRRDRRQRRWDPQPARRRRGCRTRCPLRARVVRRGLRSRARGGPADRRGRSAPAALAVRVEQAGRRDRRARVERRDGDRASVPAHRPRPGRAVRDRVVRPSDRIDRARRRSSGPPRRQPRGAPRPLGRALHRGRVPVTARLPRRARDVQRLPPAGPSGSGTCSTRCCGSATARSRSQRIPIASVPRTSRSSAATPSASLTIWGGEPTGHSSRRSLTHSRSFARGLPDVDCRGATCADHGNHRPGRLLPRRPAAREGLRGVRDGPPFQHRVVRADPPSRGARRVPPGRPARPGVAAAGVAPGAAPRGVQPRRAELRADLVEPAGADHRVHGARRDPDARGRPRDRSRHPLLPGVVVGDVRQGARDPAERDHAVLPAQPVRRRQGVRALPDRQLPRELRHVRGVGHPLQPRVAAARARVRHPEDHGRRRADQARARRASSGSETSTRAATGATRPTTSGRCG